MLSARWGVSRGISVLALIVDHGLRPSSGREAATTAERLSAHGIESRILALAGLIPGAGLAERAREARYAALTDCCRLHGIVDLLIGHHAADQAETMLMRRRAGSGADGLAGMACLSETADIRLLRPLLPLAPERLRRTLRDFGLDWVEDPSNQDPAALRTRLRRELAEPGGAGVSADLLGEAARQGRARGIRDGDQARLLAASATLRPEGFALLPPALLEARALAALIRTVTGAAYLPMAERVASLVRAPRAATLAGARLIAAGRLGPGWLLVREAAQMQPPIAARHGMLWDARFRLHAPSRDLPPGSVITAMGADVAAARDHTGLPNAVLSVMPALRGADGTMLAKGLASDHFWFGFEPCLPACVRPLFAAPGSG